MPLFSANISTLFRELPMVERIEQAAASGFDAIELQFPYAEDPIALRAALDRADLPLVLMNFPVGDLMSGGQGIAAVPDRAAEFDDALHTAAEYASILRPRAMNLLAGCPARELSREDCESRFRQNLLKAFEMSRALGIDLLIEPVNTRDLPGFLISDTRQALGVIERLPEIELRLQCDCYHMQMMGEAPLARLPQIIDQVGHIQFSDLPNRTEPGLGELDFGAIFDLLDRLGYRGYVGAEYFPTRPTGETLGWLKARR